MAHCKLSPFDFIKDAFTPQIGVISTQEAQNDCAKNNLNFTEVLQPFSRLTSDVNFKDPNGLVTTIKGLKLTFLDAKQKPPQPAVARKLLNAAVSEAPEATMVTHEIKHYKLSVPSSTPWFESWRETFFRVQYPSDHEFTKHFLGCLLIVSSRDKKPIEVMSQLVDNLNQLIINSVPGQLPKWISPNILKYHVIIHDNVEGNPTVGIEAFESFKTTYGPLNCFFLKINSRPPNQGKLEHFVDPWSQFLVKNITNFSSEPSPVSTPDLKRQMAEIGHDNAGSSKMLYHPLSPEVEDVLAETLNDPVVLPKKELSHGSCLSTEDIEQIKTMVQDFATICLMPFVEKQLALLNDAVTNKKGMSKSLLSATKRWFSTNKPTSSTITINNLIYSTDAPELQIRRLADLYFMFGNYSAAFQAYHTAKRDYHADQAWLYYAGALEMASLAAFMANESSRKTFDYMEESISTYLNTCKMPQFATRATILSSECLKSKQLYGETAYQLIRMTSEESDLRSALLLEQAACCFMHSGMLRKYAFHMVLAGHRFSKASQKLHAFRCYKQAYEVYEDYGWDLASDHIHYTIGRLANNLQKYDEAVAFFSKLLSGESKQTAAQQGTFLKEYLTILDSKLKNDPVQGIPLLSVPELSNELMQVLVGPTRPLMTPGKIPAIGINFNTNTDPEIEGTWHKLEEMLITDDSGAAPLVFKPVTTLYTVGTMETNTVLAAINEPIQVSIQLINSLQTSLILKDLYLLSSFDEEGVDSDPDEAKIKTHITKSLVLAGHTKNDLILSLTPLVTGELRITAICYTLTSSTDNVDAIALKGRKVLNVSSDVNSIKPIHVNVVPYAPCLQMTFSETNLEFVAGQIERIQVDLQNTGAVPLRNILMATSSPHLLSFCELKPNQPIYTSSDGETPQVKDKLARKNHITSIPLAGDELASGQSISFHLWIKAPSDKGPISIDLLTYYENINKSNPLRYRLIRHSWNLLVQESISVDISTQPSYHSSDAEELALALKSTNLNRVHHSISTEVTFLNIALLSHNWILTKDIVTPKFISLNSQESGHVLFKARRRFDRSLQYSNISLNSAEKTEGTQLESAFKSFAFKHHLDMLNAFRTPPDEVLPTTKDGGTLVLEWKALICDASTRRLVNGHTCIPIKIRPDRNVFEVFGDTMIDLNESSTEERSFEQPEDRVTYNLLHPAVVKHDFQRNDGCVVPVVLVLHNNVESAVSVTVNTLETSSKIPTGGVNKSSFKSNLCSVHASNHFSWLTNGKVKRVMEPLSTISVKLAVIVTVPGTFDLGANLGVYCSHLNDEDQNPVLQSCEIHSSLIVLNHAS